MFRLRAQGLVKILKLKVEERFWSWSLKIFNTLWQLFVIDYFDKNFAEFEAGFESRGNPCLSWTKLNFSLAKSALNCLNKIPYSLPHKLMSDTGKQFCGPLWFPYMNPCLQCTMLPLSTKSCLKSSKLRPILNGQFCHVISNIFVLTCSGLSNHEKYCFLWFSNSNLR